MREIKFRAWDKEEKKMFRVDRIDFGIFEIDSNVAIGPYPRVFLYNNKDDECYWINDARDFELMQYTGLKDKSGKEIFFQDLGKDRRGNIWRVDEIPRTAGWGMTCISDTGAHDECYPQLLSYGWIVMHGFEIIGNAYENPELDIP